MTLLQYIVQLMRERFPEHAEFCDELLYLKKAGLGVLRLSHTYISVNGWGSSEATQIPTCVLFACTVCICIILHVCLHAMPYIV